MAWLAALVVKLALLPTVTAIAPCVMVPVVATAVRLRPTLEAANTMAPVVVIAASPVPVVFTATVPPTVSVPGLPIVMAWLAALVVKLALLPTVTAIAPCVMVPVVATAVRLRPTLEAANTMAPVALVIAASPVPVVFTATVPPTVSVPGLPIVMAWLAALVVKLALVPTETAIAPCVMVPVVATAVRLRPTLEAANTIPVALVIVASPVPLVVSAIVPATARLFSSTELFAGLAVKSALVPTVTSPLCVMPAAVTVRVPLIVMAGRTTASVSKMVTLASPPPEGTKVTVPVKALFTSVKQDRKLRPCCR